MAHTTIVMLYRYLFYVHWIDLKTFVPITNSQIQARKTADLNIVHQLGRVLNIHEGISIHE